MARRLVWYGEILDGVYPEFESKAELNLYNCSDSRTSSNLPRYTGRYGPLSERNTSSSVFYKFI